MIRNISEDIKREVLNKYMYTKMTIKKIAKLNNLSYGEVISILEEYESIHGHIVRNLIEIEPGAKLPDKSSTDKKEQILSEINQIIYNLKKQNLSYSAIAEELEKQGIKISISTVSTACKKIFSLKGETEPKYKRVKSNQKNDESQEVLRKREVYKEQVYTLREEGLSYLAIAEELEKQGIKVSQNTVRTICKDIYISKGQTEPKASKSKKRIEESQDINKKIYELRKKGLTYLQIVEELKVQGINISRECVRKRCKELYEIKGKNEPELIKRQVDNEQIYILRQQGLSYSAIAEELEKRGIKISEYLVKKACKEIYTLKGEIEPETKKVKRKEKIDENQELNETIYEMREKGLSYREIAKELELQEITVSIMTICRRCKELYELKGKNEPKVKVGRNKKNDAVPTEQTEKEGDKKINEQQLAKAILNLMITRKATLEQVQIIADYYGVDLEKTMNSLEER